MKKYILSFLIIFILIFNIFVPQCFASTYTPVVQPTANLLDSAKYLAPALAPFAPQIALVACVAVASGVVFQNREEIITVAGGIYQDLKKAGISAIGVGTNALSFGADAISFIQTAIGNIGLNNSVPAVFTSPTGVLTFRVGSFQLAEGLTINSATRVLTNSEGWQPIALDLGSLVGTLKLKYLNNGMLYVIALSGLAYGGARINPDFPLQVKSYPLSDNSICVPINNPTFKKPVIPLVGMPGTGSISIPVDIPLSADFPVSGDWVGDLVGTSDFTKAFPVSTPIDTPIDTPADTGIFAPLVNWFTIDWSAVTGAMDFTNVWRKHFKPFYDITDALTNISSNPKNSGGKFYMVIPKEMGGDNALHCVLDFTVGEVYITWARTFIGWAIWLAFGWWILELFKPKININ